MFDQIFGFQKARTMLSLAAAAYATDPMICVHKTLPADEHWVLANQMVRSSKRLFEAL